MLNSVLQITEFDFATLEANSSVRQIEAALGREGICLIKHVPAREDAILSFANQIGTLDLGIAEVLSGPPVMRLEFDEAKAGSADKSAYFTSDEFSLHTDLTYVKNPPRWLLTLCVEPDEGGGGLTVLTDCKPAWAALAEDERAILEQPIFSFENAPNTGEGICENVAIHEPASPERWRVRSDTLICPAECDAAMKRFTQELEERAVQFLMNAGDLLIIDNYRILHGRTPFQTPSLRCMLRAYAQMSGVEPAV